MVYIPIAAPLLSFSWCHNDNSEVIKPLLLQSVPWAKAWLYHTYQLGHGMVCVDSWGGLIQGFLMGTGIVARPWYGLCVQLGRQDSWFS